MWLVREADDYEVWRGRQLELRQVVAKVKQVPTTGASVLRV